MQLSPVISPAMHSDGAGFSVHSITLHSLVDQACPVTTLDDFRVSGSPFGPHPHAGFSAVTYVLRDSPGSLRSRDSLGHDIVVGPGGIVWTEAARGLLHHEMPAQPGVELHGLQFFVNLHAHHKLSNPRVLWLDGGDVPVWRNDTGDCVRVVVGNFSNAVSPLAPAEPFTLLDIELNHRISLTASPDDYGVVYLMSGDALLSADGVQLALGQSQAVVLKGSGALRFSARGAARLIYLSGSRIDEPQVAVGPFIMNSEQQIKEAVSRYRSGEMGHLR